MSLSAPALAQLAAPSANVKLWRMDWIIQHKAGDVAKLPLFPESAR